MSMRSFDNFTIAEVENYLNSFFDRESQSRQKDVRIAMLEYELQVEKLISDIVLNKSLQVRNVDRTSS